MGRCGPGLLTDAVTRETMLADNCARHQFENAVADCRSCRARYCEKCLVYTHGPKRPPMCIPCAISAAGIRHSAAAPVHHRRSGGLFGRRREPVVANTPMAAPRQVALPEIPGDPTPNGNGNGHAHQNGHGHDGHDGNGRDGHNNGHVPLDEPERTVIPGLRVDL